MGYVIELYELFVEDLYVGRFAETFKAVEHVTKNEVDSFNCSVGLCTLTLEKFLEAYFLLLASL